MTNRMKPFPCGIKISHSNFCYSVFTILLKIDGVEAFFILFFYFYYYGIIRTYGVTKKFNGLT